MANLTAQLTLDTAPVQAQFTAVKNAAAAIPALVQAVQATVGTITVSGTPAASGTFTFVVDNSQTDAATANLLSQATTLRDGVLQLQAALDAMVPQVTNVA